MIEVFDARAVGPLACNCYMVGDPVTRQVVVVDPGGDVEVLTSVLVEKRLTVTAIVATHAHFDHIVAAERLREHTGAPFHLHPGDLPLLAWYRESGRLFLGIELPPPPEVDATVTEGDRLTAGAAKLSVLHTPGHSPGSITLVGEGALFAGDTLFQQSVGRTDLPGGDGRGLLTSIRSKLFRFADDVAVYPGHGPMTTIGEEKRSNPFVGRGAR